MNASKIRNDHLLDPYETIPDPEKFGKHRSCYSNYTNPKTLKKFSSSESGDNVNKTSGRQSTSSSKFNTLNIERG